MLVLANGARRAAHIACAVRSESFSDAPRRRSSLRIAVVTLLICLCQSLQFVEAQTQLKHGDIVTRNLTAMTTDRSNLVECFELATTRGSQWVISINNPYNVQIGVIDDCSRTKFERTDRHDGGSAFGPANINFTSGGGVYVIRVELNNIYRDPRPYVLKITQKPGLATNGFVPPGTLRFDPPRGSASTAANASSVSAAAGSVIQDCPQCPQVVVVPAGQLMMGSAAGEADRDSNEGPLHLVTFAAAFAMGRTEVTFDQWNACVADKACKKRSDNGWGEGSRPVVGVSYPDAQSYVGWLSEKTGQKYFVPSEAEWEYAARAGTTTPWNTGEAIVADDANILGQFDKTTPVASYPANAFGLYDMHGNVAEWTQDCLDIGYFGAPSNGAASAVGDCIAKRIVRGGAFNGAPSIARSAARAETPSSTQAANLGFRIARAL